MAERRKRNSMWDKEAETKHFSGMSENSYRTGKEHHSSHDSGQYREFSSSGSYRSPNFRYHSGQPSLETIEDDPVAPMNGSFTKSRERVHEGREMGGESRYYQKMSPDFRSNHSLGNDRSYSYRYPGRGRSRSPSRSLSRGRERERARGRSRSRSRSRSRGDDMAESWRNRTSHGHISRHSYSGRSSRSELRDDVSDPYYGEDDQFQSKSRSAIPCKDFIKGNCRWGDACRFSHHFASDEQQPYKNGKPLCKYFAAGRCDRDNCRFSHEDPRFNSLEGRQGKVTDEGSLGNENRNWKIPERKHNLIDRDNRPARNVTYGGDSVAGESHEDSRFNSLEGRQGKVTDEGSLGNENRNWKISERTHNLIDRDNRTARNVTYGGDLAAGESHEDSRFNSLEGRQGKVTDEGSLGNENRNWKIQGGTHNLIDRDNRPARNVTYGGELAAVESIVMEHIDKKQELLTQFQNQDGDFKVQGPNRLEVDQQMPWEPWSDVAQVSHIQQPSPVSHVQPSPVSHIQQLSHLVVENNPVSSFRSDVLVELKDPRKATVPIVLTGENLTQNGEDVFSGHSLIPSETHIGLNIPYPNPSHPVADLNLQSQMQSHEKAIHTTEVLETRILDFFPKIVTSESTPQFINPVMFPTRGPENEHSQRDVDAQVPNPMGMPLFETTNMQAYQAKVSDVPINPIQNERGTNEKGEPTEDNKMQIERSSPLPVAGGELENSGVVHSGKLKQEPVVANAEVDEGKIVTGEENKGDKNDKRTEILDGHGKNEESNANKEDKGTRLFKNALIEFVKDILKPTWKEGKMSRDVHKTIVKKVVDKVSSTIQVDHIPKTQEKVDQYLSYSQPKIAKLVQAYVGRSQKTDS